MVSLQQRVRSRVMLLSVLALPCSGACSGASAAQYEIDVRVESDPGLALAGARLLRAGQALGVSDAKGMLRVALVGAKGEVVSLEAQCPTGYRAPDKPLSVALRPIVEQGRRPEYHVTCAPLVRSLVVSVRAQEGANLPVKYLGKEIARTNAEGTAHALLKVTPGDTVTVTLDTSDPAHADLMPQNPELKLTAPARDEVVSFDQTFTRAQAKASKTRTRRAGPVRL